MTYASAVTHRSYFRPSTRWQRSALTLAFVILSFGIPRSAHAHPADQSEMRVRPTPRHLEIRLTFNILTLTRFTGIDTDGDHKISMAELKAAQSRIATYLNQHIHVEINGKKGMLGTGVHFEPLWPNPEETPPMTEPEYAARNMDVTFVQTLEGPKMLEDFWLGFEIFEQTGPMQTIHGVFEQDGRVEEVSFSVQEPEFLYDTGFADDPFLQDSAKQRKKQPARPAEPEEQPPAAPAATAAAAPAAGASAATEPDAAEEDLATISQAPGVASLTAPAVKPGVSLAVPLENKPAAAPGGKPWWLAQAAVVLLLVFLGSRLQRGRRTRAAPAAADRSPHRRE